MSPHGPPAGPHGRPEDTFARQRPRLLGIAYGMLGSITQAEGVVRHVRLRWQATDHALVADPQAYLTRATTRLSIRLAQSVRSRRESYIGPWLPEPLGTGDAAGTGAVHSESVEFGVLLMLERLDLAERAALVLRDGLASPYPEIAAVLGVDETRARHLVHSARQHLATDRGADPERREDTAGRPREDDDAEDYEAA
ncbi:RNA polymerase subunit sigma-70 [Streptomyces rubrogriseus]|uniref:RNA polymerase subunit sigma-70 n=2 Tax=Streptomyces rubrogriseus TaxID=194673 RepID=A0A6G3TE78_9ACTN|nr:RNA polymerase subunit sigma-70 [Streptomyces rubrogriseus]